MRCFWPVARLALPTSNAAFHHNKESKGTGAPLTQIDRVRRYWFGL
jgi:hypothetical protein